MESMDFMNEVAGEDYLSYQLAIFLIPFSFFFFQVAYNED